MLSKIKKIKDGLLWWWIFLLPWQAVYLWREPLLGGVKWQYGTLGLYATEILLWLIIILQLIIWLTEGPALKTLAPLVLNKTRRRSPRFWLVAGLGLLAVWSGLSIFWSPDKLMAEVYWYRLLAAMILFFIALNSSDRKKKFLWALVGSGSWVSLLALWQFFSQAVVANKWLGLAGQRASEAGTAVVAYGDYRWLRAYGAFSQPNILGGFLAVVFGAVLWLYLSERPGGRKILAALAALMTASGVFFSFSRAAWLALVLIYVVFTLTIIWRQRCRLIDWIKISFYLLAIFSLLAIVYQPLVAARVLGGERLEIKSNSERVGSLAQGWQTIKTKPFQGVGLGQYTLYLERQNPGQPAYAYQPAHNLALMIGAELGLVGWLWWLGSLLAVVCLLLKEKNFAGLVGLAVLLFLGLFDHYFWTGYFGLTFFWLALALAIKKYD